uniref:Interferon alpha-inducible protein 27-like protein 2A n=1 Tax=Scophthalmus maximus TaxID=52904 RepID=A0A8D3BRA6_SCOMX
MLTFQYHGQSTSLQGPGDSMHRANPSVSLSVLCPGGAVVAAPVVLGAIGFTSLGIAAGSYGAAMMSSAAIANGGGVAAGSAVAILQSAGMAGLSSAATAAVAGAGGTVGGLLAILI